MWKEILTIWGSGGVVFLAIAYLVRSLMTHGLNVDLERTKAALQGELAVQIERIRADLRIEAIQSEAHYSRVHADVLDLIVELLSGMHEIKLAFNNLVTFGSHAKNNDQYEPKFNELHREVHTAINTLYANFDKRRIYLRNEIAEQVDSILDDAQKAYHSAQGTELPENPMGGVRVEFNTLMNSLLKKLGQQVDALQNEFHRMLYEGPSRIYAGEKPTPNPEDSSPVDPTNA